MYDLTRKGRSYHDVVVFLVLTIGVILVLFPDSGNSRPRRILYSCVKVTLTLTLLLDFPVK